ncbi:hypothetical protein EBR43_03890 [bacterium]|nr:hypothetical protein [bacterium]
MTNIVEETIEQFLARGGKKEVLPYMSPDSHKKQEIYLSVVKSILDLSEGELYFSSEKKKNKKPIKVDNSKLPAGLLDKLRERGIEIDG